MTSRPRRLSPRRSTLLPGASRRDSSRGVPAGRLSLLIAVLVASVLLTVGAGRAAAPIEAAGPRSLTQAVGVEAVGQGAVQAAADEPVHPLYHHSGSESALRSARAGTVTAEAAPARVASGELAAQITSLDPASIGAASLAPTEERAQPVRLVVAALGVDAEIVPVGVLENGDYEVPPASQVGWYRFGSAPGDPGSAVLAGHIAWNGEDGVFRRLADLPAGSEIEVFFDDGSTVHATTGEISRIDKDELPSSLFERSGEPRIVLITCGGAFNRTLRSYEDNVITTAR